MEAKIGKLIESVANFFVGGDSIPWCDREIVAIEPEWRQAMSLKRAIEEQIKKDGIIGIGIAATAVGLVAGGLTAAFGRRN